MTENSVRKHRDAECLPSQVARPPRAYRTRPDPLAAHWPEIAARLAQEPRLKPFALLQWLREKYPDTVSDSLRRSLERRVQQWKLEFEVQQEAMFSQDHPPGDVLAFDFVDLRELGITILSQPFPHLLFHAVLTCSNWESIQRCHTESFEALSLGLQDALHLAGGVPRRVRSDSLTAAVNNLSSDREFQPRYAALLAHYGLAGHRINVRKPHENGDVESSHGHLKEALRQALYLRGGNNFSSVAEYDAWARSVVAQRNRGRQAAFARELPHLGPLPHTRLTAYSRHDLRVGSDSLLRLRQNTYSVNSKLIGLRVEARVHQDEIELWYAGKCVERMPRKFGQGQVQFDYRHVIDSLVRKPGAFRNYRYVEYMFPTLVFRQAYDQLCQERQELPAVKQYLRILKAAKYDGQELVEDALRGLLAAGTAISEDAVLAVVHGPAGVPLPERVAVDPPDLKAFDKLLTHKEVYDETSGDEIPIPDSPVDPVPADRDDDSPGEFLDEFPGEFPGDPVTDPAGTACGTAGPATTARSATAGGTTQGVAVADDSGGTPSAGGPSSAGAVDAHAVSGRIDGAGMPDPDPESRGAAGAKFTVVGGQDLGPVPVVAAAPDGGPAVRAVADGRVPGATDESVDLRKTRFGEDESALCVGGRTGSAGSDGLLHDLSDAGPATVGGETRSAAGTLHQVAGQVRSADHRRLGLCGTKPRGDGSPVHPVGGTLRTGERAVEQQLAVLEVGSDFQGPDDDRRGRGSRDSSLGDHRAEHRELPPGAGRGPAQTTRSLHGIGDRLLGFLRHTFCPANLIVAKEQN